MADAEVPGAARASLEPDLPAGGVTVVLDVVTDIVCPYSYIGHLKIAKAIEAARKAASPIDVVVYHHPFQLDSTLPEDHPIDRDERLQSQLKDKFPAYVDSVNQKGKSVGVSLKPGGTIRQTTNAHRLMMLAVQRGGPAMQLPFLTSLYEGYWDDLDDPGDPDMLADKAARARLFHDREEAKEWILGDDMRDELNKTYAKLKLRGIRGVPFIVINRKFALCGAQEPDELLELFFKVSQGKSIALTARAETLTTAPLPTRSRATADSQFQPTAATRLPPVSNSMPGHSPRGMITTPHPTSRSPDGRRKTKRPPVIQPKGPLPEIVKRRVNE